MRLNGPLFSSMLVETVRHYEFADSGYFDETDPDFPDVMYEDGLQSLILAHPSEVPALQAMHDPERTVVADPSTLPIFSFPGKVLFPDDRADLIVNRKEKDPFLRRVEQGRTIVRRDGKGSRKLVKFRARETMETPGEICTLGTVQTLEVDKNGTVTLLAWAHARVRSSYDSEETPFPENVPPVSRNPAYEAFGACADYPEIRGNFEELIRRSSGLDAVDGADMLDTLEALEKIADMRYEWDARIDDWDEREKLARERAATGPLLFLDVAADFLASSLSRRFPDLEVPVRIQQKWLDILDPNERLRDLNTFIVRALDEMKPEREYESALRKRVERYEGALKDRADGPALMAEGVKFLKERIDDTREQLADPDARLRGRLEACGMPGTVRRQLQPEIDGLSDTADVKVKNYFESLADLPWRAGREETIDCSRARRLLDEGHLGLEEAKERILEYLAVRARKHDAKAPVLCLVGPPGVGKTSLARSIAGALGRKFAEMSCNGMSDASDVYGLQRTWAGARPGQIIQELRRVGSRNPVFVLDEIDKMGDAAGAALLDVLDPLQNAGFRDHYLEVPFDLSQVFFVTTANVLLRIPAPLQNRLKPIEIAGYGEEDKFEIARKFLVERQILDNGLTGLIEFDDEALRAIIRDHTNEVGIRELDRGISEICGRVALRLAEDAAAEKVEVTEKMVGEMLGTGRTAHGRGVFGVEHLRAKIELGGLPWEVRNRGRRELEGLLVSSPRDSEYAKNFDYLQWLVGLPWNVCDEEKLDQERTRRLLDERHWGLAKAKERILEYLAARRLGGDVKGSILCFVGPPGVGKTSLAGSIAEALGRKLATISCSGMGDETELRGHNRTWRGAQPGRIVRELRKVAAKNPVLVLDEIDKMGRTTADGGDPRAALLEILDPAQHSRFSDNYIEEPFDLSKVFFVATANLRETIPPPLRDRLEMIDLPGYSEDEKFRIAREHLLGRQLAANGLTAGQVRFADEALRVLIRGYTREAGVRSLGREIGALCRKVAVRRVEGNESPVEITAETVAEMLGAPRHSDEQVAERTERPGVAVGLVWTAAGGDVLFVEARRMGGGGALTLTGQLGGVMRESAQAALSWVRANAARYHVDPGFYCEADMHLHVPAGADPKEGPSAGIAMVTALVSELTGRPVRSDLAMTGEITLSGNVLPVGGIKEKVLAARRLGLAEVVVPKRNQKQVDEDLGDLRREIAVRYVSMVDEALDLALLPAAREQPRQ